MTTILLSILVSSLTGLTAGFLTGATLRVALLRRSALQARVLPLPVTRQVWRIEGIGRVRIDSLRGSTVYFCRPAFDPNANPLVDSHWRDGTIGIPLEEFDKLATLEHR